MSAASRPLAPAFGRGRAGTVPLPARSGPLAALLRWRPVLRSETLILLASLYFTALANPVFWKAAVPAPIAPRWILSLVLMAVAAQGFLLGLLLWPRIWRGMLFALVLLAAIAGHYMAAYGIYIDADMVRNVVNTDWAEARDLLGPDVLRPLLVSLPALLFLARVRITPRRPGRVLLVRAMFLVAMVMLGLAGAAVSMQSLSSFLRNQREVRYLLTPANAVVSLAKVASERPRSARVQLPIGEDAVQLPAATMRRPRLLVLVVGETARAANWGLGGYHRQTTPALARRDVVNYPHVTACGSSTEVSLPCMFSPQGRADYDGKAIRGHQSVLHVLQRAGVSVLWRDNQSGCKGVCSGLAFEDFRGGTDRDLCRGAHCFDGILVRDLAAAARREPGDRVLVLHMLGNHGPTYSERYPAGFARYTPVCATSDLGRCERAHIVNAYDNALLYTDHVLGQAIDALAGMEDYDTALLYLSDHGESLGENRLYLHGMPHAIAPVEQLRVPMVAWFSRGWRRQTGLDIACVRGSAGLEYTHDNLFHTLLGLTDVRTTLYDPGRDIYLPCRRGSQAHAGEAGPGPYGRP